MTPAVIQRRIGKRTNLYLVPLGVCFRKPLVKDPSLSYSARHIAETCLRVDMSPNAISCSQCQLSAWMGKVQVVVHEILAVNA